MANRHHKPLLLNVVLVDHCGEAAIPLTNRGYRNKSTLFCDPSTPIFSIELYWNCSVCSSRYELRAEIITTLEFSTSILCLGDMILYPIELSLCSPRLSQHELTPNSNEDRRSLSSHFSQIWDPLA